MQKKNTLLNNNYYIVILHDHSFSDSDVTKYFMNDCYSEIPTREYLPSSGYTATVYRHTHTHTHTHTYIYIYIYTCILLLKETESVKN